MGGKGGDRKSYKATSSAKAAEALAAKGGAAGFGGFSGVRPVAGFGFGAPAAVTATASGPANGDAPEVSSQLDGDLAQCLRHLSKKDTTTKMKALQSLKDLIPQKSASDLTLLLQPWVFQYKKLLLDPSKLVRSESAAVMAAIASSVGKALLPQLKSVLGPWYLACFDPYPDAAAAAKRSMSEVFPGKKQVDALVYCRSEVLTHITTSLTSTPASLGDVRKDTPEELEERHERIVAASLAAAAALLTTLQQQQTGANEQDSAATAAAAAAVQEVQDKLQEILQTAGFFKKYLGSKSTVIRRAAYKLMAALSSATPRLLQECQAAAAPSVLGALQEKEPSNHPVMWEMLLSYITSQQPSCWQHINMQKAFIPRLLAFLRHGCYGSAASSLPALLPLLALLPRQQLQGGVLLQQVLEAVWVGGLQQYGPSSAGRTAAAAAYKECMNWGLKNAAVLSGNAAAAAAAAADAEQQGQQQQEGRQYCEQLLLHGHFSTLLETSLAGSNAEGEAALAVVQDLLLLQCSSSSSNSSTVTSGSGSREIEQSAPSDQLPLQLDVVLAALSAAAQQQLVQSVTDKQQQQQQQGISSNAVTAVQCSIVFSRLQSLFDSLVDSASSHAQAAASRLAARCCAALLPLLQAGQQLPAAASQLVARLIREYPGAAAAGRSNAGAVTGAIDGSSSSSSIAALVQMGIRTSSSGEQLSAADCDLLLSCIAGSTDTAAAWGEVFDIVAAAEAAGSAIAAWRFMDALLRRFVSTPVPAAAGAGVASAESADDWSHSGLDALVVHLMKQLAAAAEAGVVIGTGPVGEVLQYTPTAAAAADVSGQLQQQHHHHWDLSRSQAAAASLLGCCLGANEQQQVLLGHDAVKSALQHMQKCLAAAYVAVQQQQIDELSEAVAAAATVVIAALHMALESSSHAAGTSSSSMWQQQPDAVVELLLLLAQLSWGNAQELLLPELGAAAAGFSSSDEDDDVSSSSGDDSSSNGGEGGICDTQQQAVTVTLDSSSSSNMPAHLTAVQQAAYRVWNAGLFSSMVGDLPADAAQQLVQQLQLLLSQGLATAAVAADDDATAAAVEAGLRWGNRAVVVLSALDNQQQQQEVLQQLLTAVSSWQHWSSSSSSGDGSSTINAHLMMMQFCIVLVLEVGCELLVALSGHHFDVSTADAESNSDNSSCRQWLLLELLCSATAAAQDTGHSNSSAHLQGITAAAAATQHHLLRCACRSSNASAAVTAQRVLAGTLSTLLALAGNAAAAENATVAAVHCNALTDLLQQAVALYNAHSSQKAALLSVLQDFAATEVIVAASSYMKTSAATAAHGSSSSTYPSWVLAAVIDVLAGAFRFTGDEASVVSSRISDLSLGFINKALAAADSESSSSSSSNEELQGLMQLVVACFPMQSTAQQEHNAHHHATATAAAKGVPVSAGSSTAQERQGLTALLRYVGSSSNAAAAADVQCKLQLCCVAYCWSDMSAAEWHIVLRDSQQRLTAVRRDIERAAGSLAAAACSAAQQLMGSSAGSSDDVITPAMAIEILRRLARKGLLQRQAATKDQLAAAAEQAASGLSKVSLPGLRLGLLLLAAVQQLQQQIQAAGRAPQLDLALQSAWRELLAMLLALGAAAAVAAASGPSMAAVLLDSLAAEGPTWQLLGSCLGPIDTAAVDKALAAADERVEMIGVDSVSSCLSLLQLPWTATTAQQQRLHSAACQPLQQLAWKLLLHPSSLANVTHAAAAAPGSSSSSDGEEVPEFGVNDDPAMYLVQVGFRPDMAAVIAAAEPWQVQLLHWSLLLAHISHLTAQRSSATSSAASRRLTQALRDVPELVPELLHRVVGIMGLGGSSSSSSGNLAAAYSDESSLHPITSAAGSSAAAQAQLSAKLSALCPASSTASGGWSLSEALTSINLPIHHPSWRLLSAALYRSVLSLLPASARIWFNDLRDRSRITAVEAYTTKYESPALLAAEFAAIKRDAAGSAGEVGGSCSFRVTASPAAREVTAVLEIEDGATLELQVKLPAAAPLKAAEVECKNKVGIKDGRLRKWLLSIAVFLRNQNQGVLDAISMWKANLEQEFAGVQPCLICYSVISAANGQLPRLSCKQCSVTFHPACLYKWFRSSGKSTCPHCQAPW